MILMPDRASNSKVENLHDARASQKGVGRLEIRMDNALPMRVVHRVANVSQNPDSFPDAQAEPFAALDEPIERLAFEQFHHHVDVRAVPVEVVNGHDVRMSELLPLARLALQRAQ